MAAAIVMAVVVAGAAVVMAPGKGSGKNLKKASLQKRRRFPLGLLTQKGARVGVISIPINVLPA